jgi:hypothetical protein
MPACGLVTWASAGLQAGRKKLLGPRSKGKAPACPASALQEKEVNFTGQHVNLVRRCHMASMTLSCSWACTQQ